MLKFFCNLLFKMYGWTYKSDLPEDLRSFIFLGAPHTSNFDFVPAMAVAVNMHRNAKFVIKDDWLKFPFNLIMKPAGALGINRKQIAAGKASTTDFMAQLFKEYPELVLMIAPEGTRGAADEWKTGFYYIAEKARVPIVLGYADFKTKTAGTGPIVYPQNFERDMQKIMEFYGQVTPCKLDNFKLDRRFVKSR